jgi:glycosyltransferase involved in cell wall biosynthesis
VVVVDNGSVDETAAIARAAVRSTGQVDVTVIGCSRPGKGNAVHRGLLTSGSPFVGFFDADLATPLETLVQTMHALQRGATAVIASRHAPGASFAKPQSFKRRLGGTAFRAITRTLVPGVHDTQCGFKFFQRHAIQRAVARCRTTGFAFDVELLAQIRRDGGTIAELPVAWTDQVGSTFHPVRDGVPSFAAVLSLRSTL